MVAQNVPYQPGSLVAIPLRGDCGYAVGLIALCDQEGGAIGFFFGPCFDHIPTVEEIGYLSQENAVLVANFGDLGILEGRWQLLGQYPHWESGEWPMPIFVRNDPITGKVTTIQYDEHDLARDIHVSLPTSIRVDKLPQAGIFGAGAVELRLTKLLCSK